MTFSRFTMPAEASRFLSAFPINLRPRAIFFFFFFNDPAPTEFYPFPLHAAFPIFGVFDYFLPAGGGQFHRHYYPAPRARNDLDAAALLCLGAIRDGFSVAAGFPAPGSRGRSEEHTSELQSQSNLVCRLLLEKKKQE